MDVFAPCCQSQEMPASYQGLFSHFLATFIFRIEGGARYFRWATTEVKWSIFALRLRDRKALYLLRVTAMWHVCLLSYFCGKRWDYTSDFLLEMVMRYFWKLSHRQRAEKITCAATLVQVMLWRQLKKSQKNKQTKQNKKRKKEKFNELNFSRQNHGFWNSCSYQCAPAMPQFFAAEKDL